MKNSKIWCSVLYYPDETTDGLEAKLLWLFQNKLNLDPASITIERCHRIGTILRGKTRPVIVRFLSYKMRWLIWKNKNRLKGSNTFVTESYPAEIKYRRKVLWPYLLEKVF